MPTNARSATSSRSVYCGGRESRSSRPSPPSRPGRSQDDRPADAPWSPDPDAEESLKSRFGENVRLLRARVHISQDELGFRSDVHRTQISLIESGQRLPRIGTALKLAAALEVELSTLLAGITYRPRFFSAARGEFEI